MKSWIIFQDLETRYFILRRQFKIGEITSQQYFTESQHLRIRDGQGVWWQMRPEDGNWLCWNGSSWEPAIPPHLTGPQTLVDFIYVLLKELFKGLLWKLPISIGAALVVWATHTVLVVGVNDGLPSGKNALLDMVLTLPGKLAPGIIFWFMLACLISIIMVRVITPGFKQVILQITETPAWIEYSLSGSEGNAIISVLLGCGLALLFGVIVGNRLVSFLLLLMALGALISQDKSLILWALRLAWSDGLRLINRPPRPFNPAWGGLILIGSIFGFMGAVVLPLMPYTGCVGIFLLVMLVTLLVLARQGHRSQRMGMLLVPLLLLAHPVRAGPITFSELWVVIAYGILPAWGAFCGTLLGLSLGRWERSGSRMELDAVDPAQRQLSAQSQAWSNSMPANALAQPLSQPPSDDMVILKGQPALDILDRLSMIKRVATPQGGRYLPVTLEPQGPVAAIAYFLDEQGYLIPQLAIAYSPPTPASEQLELEMQSYESQLSAEAEEVSQPSAENQPETPPSEAGEIANDLHPPEMDQGQ
jgi:hypothetical protein